MISPPDDSWAARNRGWALAVVLIVAVVAAAVIGSRSTSKNGGGVPGLQILFGAHIQPPAGSNGSLPFNNGWIASGGRTDGAIAVYAAAVPSNRQDGLLVIQRHTGNQARPWQTRDITLHGSGALTLLRPGVPATESAAFQETLHFVTASGDTGTLDLGTDRVSLSG